MIFKRVQAGRGEQQQKDSSPVFFHIGQWIDRGRFVV